MAELDGANGVSLVAPDESDEISRLRNEIARSRRRLGSSLHQLEQRVADGVDWRHWVRAHPFASLAAGAALGYAVGHFKGRRRRAANRG